MSLTGCEGCNYILTHALLALGIEPVYYPEMVEETNPPRQVDVLVITGACFDHECCERIASIASRAQRILLVGCCALNCGVYARTGYCRPPSAVLAGHPGVWKVPGCPPHRVLLETSLKAILASRTPRLPRLGGRVAPTPAHSG